MYDAIIIGARVAGSPTAMLLAQKGYKVLLLERDQFPSDTISTHIVFSKCCSLLNKWGLLDKIKSSNVPDINKITLGLGPLVLT
ncbi:MAG TPA: FAD-dependent monooxygenase, partial [Saprospiraceae bacterium]|nr:FAD-dependent monooxygenase [Saprospiraceae bacterium]